MPSRRLSILAGVSVGMLLVLVYGYFAHVGPLFQRVIFAGSTCSIRGFYIGLDHGCCEVSSFHWTEDRAYFPTLRPGFQVYFLFKAARPTMHESLSGFHAIDADSMGGGFRFPIWCLILPCMIAPLLWLCRRRRHLGRGFAVEPAGSRETQRGHS